MDATFHTCLLIDDSPLDNFINYKMIKRANFADDIVISDNPVQALSLLKDGAVHPDVIFLDIRMPVMNGFEFLQEYDKIDIDKDHTKIYMLSSSIDPNDINKANKNKYVSKFITKSLSQEILLALAS
jgi:CheY-like chemotaxis protein